MSDVGGEATQLPLALALPNSSTQQPGRRLYRATAANVLVADPPAPQPVDGPVDISSKLRERVPPGPALRQRFRWWRGEDLNLRPSGYEPQEGALPYSLLVPCSTADKAIRATFVTSRVVFYRAMREITALFAAQRSMQDDKPRSVMIAGKQSLALHPVGRRGYPRSKHLCHTPPARSARVIGAP